MSTDLDLPPFSRKAFVYTQNPNPEWTYGRGVTFTEEGRKWMEGFEGGYKTVDVANEDPMRNYQLMKSAIIPRPIAFVSTTSEENGIDNLAPYSFFQMVSGNPPVISISIASQPRIKDTMANIKAIHGFVVNLVSEPWMEQADVCSIDAPRGVSEWGVSGLTKLPSVHVRPPRVKESAFSMECEFLQAIELRDPKTDEPAGNLVLATVKYIHARKDILNSRGYVEPTKFLPVARVGDVSYARISELYRMPRRGWDEEEKDIPHELKEL